MNTFKGIKKKHTHNVIGVIHDGLTCFSAATLFNATNTIGELELFLSLNNYFFFTHNITTCEENIKNPM